MTDHPRPWTCACHGQRALWMWTSGLVLCSVTRDVIARMPRQSIDSDTDESKVRR